MLYLLEETGMEQKEKRRMCQVASGSATASPQGSAIETAALT